MRKSTISILDKELLYRDKRIRFTPLRDDGTEDDDRSFTVNGDDDSLKILHFENDCIAFFGHDGSTIRFDPKNYRAAMIPTPVRLDETDHNTGVVGLTVRSYDIVDDDGELASTEAIEILDYTFADEVSEYSGELVLEIDGEPRLVGEDGTSDRELLTLAGYQLVGRSGDREDTMLSPMDKYLLQMDRYYPRIE